MSRQDQETVQERVQELTWALVDDQINQEEMELLEGLLLSGEDARGTYLNCVQLHAELVGHFADKQAPSAKGKTPILSFLQGASPSVDVQPSA